MLAGHTSSPDEIVNQRQQADTKTHRWEESVLVVNSPLNDDKSVPEDTAVASSVWLAHPSSGEITIQSQHDSSADEITIQTQQGNIKTDSWEGEDEHRPQAEEHSLATDSNKNDEMPVGLKHTLSSEDAGVDRTDTLREQLRERSLEAKQHISKQLQTQSVSPVHTIIQHYQHHQNQAERTLVSCDEEDAFPGIPVDGAGNGAWVPPGGYPLSRVQTWDSEYNISMRRIKDVSSGGTVLRNFAKQEVLRHRKLRHKLFCGNDLV